ncbi:MAG: hypothetical protein HY301_00325 [Verrucomicrobia bacterium]|nr:hypothetical protein [Verrucomicrobiota bacterium]
MRLFEAIVAANHRAAAGDTGAGLRPDEFADALPVVALTCIDPRLNPLLPAVLGIGPEHFIWLRNAGNILTGPMSSTMRSLALACAVKGGREIVVIGHTDCLVCKTSMMQVLSRFQALGVDRAKLPENLQEYFGLFASERQNVMKAVEFIRHSPLIGPRVPVHGLLVDIESGKLEWIVNGYQVFDAAVSTTPTSVPSPAAMPVMEKISTPPPVLPHLPDFKPGEMKFPSEKIGSANPVPVDWMAEVEARIREQQQPTAAPPPKLPTEAPSTKRKYEPRPPTIPLPERDDEGKLIQPWKKPRR